MCDFQGTNAILIGLDRKDPTTLFPPVMMLMIRSLSFKIFMPLLPKDTCLVCLCMSETIRDQDFVAEEQNVQLLESLGGLAHLICFMSSNSLGTFSSIQRGQKEMHEVSSKGEVHMLQYSLFTLVTW
jgi:hypothetical protein